MNFTSLKLLVLVKLLFMEFPMSFSISSPSLIFFNVKKKKKGCKVETT